MLRTCVALLYLSTIKPAASIDCYKCNSTKNEACKRQITNSSSVTLSSCSFGIGTHCATISYSQNGVSYVERDCLPTNLDCDSLQKFMWGRYGPLEDYKCALCGGQKCNFDGVFDGNNSPKESGGESRVWNGKIYIFLYILFLAVLIGMVALCEF